MRYFYSIIFAIILFAALPVSGKDSSFLIDSFEPVKINGIEQWILIRSNNPAGEILLYLHGGPGHSLVPFAHAATGTLAQNFIVVYWDQRGTGMSLNDNIPADTMTIAQFVDDTKKVTEYLKEKFHKDKIFILGHSWGSVLGTLAVKKYPGDYYAFISAGPVISMDSLERERAAWLKKMIMKNGTKAEKEQVMKSGKNYFARVNLIRKYGGTVHNPLVMEKLHEIMQKSPYFPGLYTQELYDKGYNFSKKIEVEERKNINFFRQAKDLNIPVYFFLGRFDNITPTAPVLEYYKILKAPFKKIIWFENSAHRMDIEESDFFQENIASIMKSN
jgi:pimeloyl-ACP methyl ester carboxylesterase